MYVASLFWIFTGGVGREFYGGGVVGAVDDQKSLTRHARRSLFKPRAVC